MTSFAKSGPIVIVPDRPMLVRAAIVALVLGSVLTFFNQAGAIVGDGEIQWLALALVYLTPFAVVSISQLLGVRAAQKYRGRDLREKFLATMFSRGVPVRAVALGLVAGGLNTAIVAAVNGLDPLPVGLIAQAVSLPFLFGLLSQTISFRRALR